MEKKIETFYKKYQREKTYQHVKEVAVEAKALARLYHVDEDVCEKAALLHDISAVMNANQMYDCAKERGLSIDKAEETYHFLLHQRISRIIALEKFAVRDERILSAIECHTTLKKDANIYDKILFIADKIAWDQQGVPPYLEEVKQAMEISLDYACYVFIDYQFQHHLLKMPHTWIEDAYRDLRKKI